MCTNCAWRSSGETLQVLDSCLCLTRNEKSIGLSCLATVRSLTAMPQRCSSAAILAVVRRVHFKPVMGSPAVSCCISDSIRAMISGVFFHRFAPAAACTDPIDFDGLGEQLASSPRDRAHIEAKQLGDAHITAATGLEGFEPGVPAPLLLIEQAEEQYDGRAQLIRYDRDLGQRPEQPGLGQAGAARPQLLAPTHRVARAVQKSPCHLIASQAHGVHELAQRILGGDVQHVVELLHEVAELRALHQSRGRLDQGAAH